MKKYKQILAGLLAMNLAVYVMPTGMVQISASVQNQNSENKDTEKIETNSVESADTTNSVEANSLDDESENAVSVQAALSDAAETDISEDFSTGDGTDTPEDNASDNIADTPEDTGSDNNTNTESPEENQNDNASADMTEPSAPTDSANTDLSDSTEDAFSDGTQPEEAKAAAFGEDVAVQAGENETGNDIKLAGLKAYNSNSKTFTITKAEQLILLSYCDPEEIKGITIQFSVSGEIDFTKKIEKGTDISEFYSITTAASVVSNQDASNKNTETEDADAVQTENDVQNIKADTQSTSASQNVEETDQTEAVALEEESAGEKDVFAGEDSVLEIEETEVTESENSSQNEASVQAETEIVKAGQDYTFQGIGKEDNVFQGKVIGQVGTIKIDNTFFGGLSSKVEISVKNNDNNDAMELTWCGDGTKPMIAGVYQFDAADSTEDNSDGNHKFPINVKGNNGATMGSLIGTVQQAKDVTNQTLTIGNVVNYGTNKVNASLNTGNAGLICGTLKSGTICLDGYTLPTSAYTVMATASGENDKLEAGNAGGLIGVMGENTKLSIQTLIAFSSATAITSSTGNAGGVAGLMRLGAQVEVAEKGKLILTAPVITGAVSAGGVAGTAENVNITGARNSLNIDSPVVKGSKPESNVGGFIGHYTLKNTDENENEYNFPDALNLSSPTVSATNTSSSNKKGNSGGYFGYLELSGKWNCVFGNDTAENKIEFSSVHGDDKERGNSYGSIAGKVTSNTRASTVKIQNMEIISEYKNQTVYHGGLIGELGTANDLNNAVYLETANVNVTVKNPYADGEKRGFGGLVGCLAKGSILKVTENTIIATTGTDPQIWEGGGIVGRAEPGSVLELSGETDLSDVRYVGNRKEVGWLVGYQDCALIYARGDGDGNGWKYTRGSAATQFASTETDVVNDIANYGQIIRLKDDEGKSISKLSNDLIAISDDHKITLENLSLSEGNEIVLNSADDFALLSIVWNSRGYFSPDSSVDNNSWQTLKGKSIQLLGDIDLTDSGIIGLSRDNNFNNDDDTYTGIFDGNGHEIKLCIGKKFGFKKNDNDCDPGTIYGIDSYHAALGIFAKTKNAQIKNVTIGGTINLSNRGNSDIGAGGIAAFVIGENSTIVAVTAKESITADGYGCSRKDTNMSVGGLYGEGSNGGLTLQNNTVVSSKIALANNRDGKDSYVYAGEVLGQITSEGFKLAVNGLTVGGKDTNDPVVITTDAREYAYVGGLVGFIKPITQTGKTTNTITENRWIEIRSLTFNNFNINAENVTKVCGGLFGSIWANVGVYFMGESDTTDGAYADQTKMMVQDATINAPKASGIGGLAYRSSGIWEIRDKGIDIQKLSITANGDVGLLICRGEKGEEGEAKKEANPLDLGAVYVKMTKNWKDSYKLATDDNITITQQDKNSIFDEFVAHTAANETEITYNGDNGVISLATKEKDGERVGVEENNSNDCTTYQNRTAYGQKHKTNIYSRYYYDLDQYWSYLNNNQIKATDSIIDDPKELMLWSVYRYSSDNIKHFFTDSKDQNGETQGNAFKDLIGCNTIGGNSIQAAFNMRKYSYYPIDISSDITVKNAKITFYNEQIENAEIDNKSTQAKTQHYTMHCGLFLNQIKGNTTVTVNKVTFAGSIGKINEAGSGVLFAGNVAGSADDTQLHIATVSLKEITFAGLKVNNCGDGYAPLLINSIGNYTTLDVNGVKIVDKKYTQGTAVASSLIGKVGSETGRQINLSFLNIVLPDKKAENNTGIFSHATLLESFQHDGSSSVATYNFYMTDEWKNGFYTHGVTYGKEITETKEYIENGQSQQLWYYDEENYGEKSNRVHTTTEDLTSFSSSGYLPYVYKEFSEAEKSHEIKVNQRVTDITHGCGTYSHPYKITSEREMSILSEYMSTGTARPDWCVTITGGQSDYHTGDDKYTYSGDKTYQFNGSDWVQVKKETVDGKEIWQSVKDTSGNEIKLARGFMLQYLLNAYYDIQGSNTGNGNQLKLNNFGGFGIATRPFRGVITSSNGTTVILSGASTSKGLIPYSYGSVVKNLTVHYQKNGDSGKTLTYDGIKTSEYYPDECFGGVIGCVLGGDNIIDNVTVTMDDSWLTLAGGKAYLIQVGGYVGSVSGGGVIFRNMPENTGLTDGKVVDVTGSGVDNTYAHMYVNPYVGRVLDGFAFYEVTDTGNTATNKKYASSLNNTDKNYKINTLDTSDTESVKVENNTITANDAQGLLILSAIINSGAGSGGQNNAYSSATDGTTYSTTDKSARYNFAGKYGKVRNASYNSIKDSASDDEKQLSCADDQTKPGSGSMPYLIQKYCGASETVFNMGTNGADIKLADNGQYDMTVYGSGYQGLTARYISNAILQENAVNAKGIIPELLKFDGCGSTVTLDTQVKEYKDDDYKAVSVGGLFNFLRVGASGTVCNLTISGRKEKETDPYSGVSIHYYSEDGSESTEIPENNKVDVGAFAGMVTGLSAASGKTTGSVTFDGVTLQNLTVDGKNNAGGLLGSSIKTNKPETNQKIRDYLFRGSEAFSVGVTVKDSKYDNIAVEAPNATGGFVGYIENDSTSSLIVTTTEENYLTGKESQIGLDDNSTSYSGGVFGCAKSAVNVNANADNETYTDAVLQNVTVKAKESVGGFIGQIGEAGQGKCYQINRVTFKGEDAKTVCVSVEFSEKNQNFAGGIVGRVYGSGNDCKIQKGNVIQAQIKEKTKISNGDVISGHGGIAGRVEGTEVTISDCNVEKTSVTGGKSGGIVGNTAVTITIKNCTVQGTGTEKSEITGTETAGGIVGLSNASSKKIQIEQCKVSNMKMTSNSWGCGGMLGDVDWNAVLDTLYLFDCSVEGSEVKGTTSGTTAGGFTGDIRGKLVASNLLLSDVKIHTKLENKVGMVIGMADSRTGGMAAQKEPGIVSVAGLSIQNTKAYYDDNEAKTVTQLYGVIVDNTQTEITKENMNKYSYFAFADYSGRAAKNTGLLEGDVKAPYVVTSPKSALSVRENSETEEEFLYGDGAFWTNGNKVMAQEICTENAGNHYEYSKSKELGKDFDFTSLISTYNTNQTTKVKDGKDFPVVQVSAGNVDAVKNYLDIVTNGGFSAANDQNTTGNQHVTATAVVYRYENGSFVKDTNTSPAFNVETDASGKIIFSTTTDYDNNQNRFTLLTVTFTEKGSDGEEHKYNVLVPVLVRRMLEIDFTATLTYGTDFKSSDYKDLTSHVLENFGSSVTGYLTYTYNSAENKYTDYGWESYINAGGDLTEIKKSIRFTHGTTLPKGTQLSLVDCRDKRVYYYTAKGSEDEETGAEKPDASEVCVEIPLSCFKDSDGNSYQEPTISELLGVEASETGDNKLFIKVDANGKPVDSTETESKDYPSPTIKIKNKTSNQYEYYRLASSTLKETGKYSMVVDEDNFKDDSDKTVRSTVNENYYLVINVPRNENTEKMSLNGSVRTTVNSKIPHQVHYRKISGVAGPNGTDDHSNTASTYLLSNGYEQKLEETNISDVNKKISMSDSVLKIDVKDTITFPNDQVYNKNDQLYLRFVGGLQKTTGRNESASGSSAAEQFPSGTTGTANFYVYTEENGKKVYYRYTGTTWTQITDDSQIALSYTWTSNGGNMELLLSEDGKNAVSLQALRGLVKGGNEYGSSTFYVEVKMDATIPGAGLDVIPESKTTTDGSPEDYVKLTYYSQLSTEKQSLTYSSNRATAPSTRTEYYREEPSGVELTYDADKIDQLGINLLDLQRAYLDAEEQNTYIDTTATYDLSAMKNLKDTLKNSSGIKFTLTLMPKKTESGSAEEYNSALSDAQNYLSVELRSQNSGKVDYDNNGIWSWTVPKDSYYDMSGDQITTSSVFDGSKLLQAIRLKVNVANIEEERHFYSNYKVVLTAEILDRNNTAVMDTHKDDNIIYTLAKIKPKFVDKNQ